MLPKVSVQAALVQQVATTSDRLQWWCTKELAFRFRKFRKLFLLYRNFWEPLPFVHDYGGLVDLVQNFRELLHRIVLVFLCKCIFLELFHFYPIIKQEHNFHYRLKSQLFQLFRNGTYHDNFSATIRNGLSADLTPNSCVEFSGFQIDPYSNANAINVWDKYCKPFFHAIASCWWTS